MLNLAFNYYNRAADIIEITACIEEICVRSVAYQQVPEVCGLEELQRFVEGDDRGRVRVLTESCRTLHTHYTLRTHYTF